MRTFFKAAVGAKGAGAISAEYWTQHNVTSHHAFQSTRESLDYFRWRNDQYFGYIELMPITGQDGKAVLDFGCGPGHDLVGFGVFSSPFRLVGADVSETSLQEAKARAALHALDVELVALDPHKVRLPFPDQSFDHIHSSGVLHHLMDPTATVAELFRILRPGGTANIMVYNYHSVWLHLYVAYERCLVQGLHSDLTIAEQFKRSTDGEDCPISRCYQPHEWIDLGRSVGFQAEHKGNAISAHEMSLLPRRFAAVQDRRLRDESREFLVSLEFDRKGLPVFVGKVAGIDACYSFRKVV